MNEAAAFSRRAHHEQMHEFGLNFREAREAVATGSVFTTHTPVPAGIDRFSPQLVTKYLGSYCQALGINLETLLELGRMNVADKVEPFCMAVLALRLSYLSNGVSQVHGDVSRKMFSGVYPGVPTNEVPITSITNGIHTRSWLSRDVAHLFDQYLGPQWADDPPTPASGSAWTSSLTRVVAVARAAARAAGGLARRGSRPSSSPAAPRPPRWTPPTRSSTPRPSPSVSPGASPPTSGPCCCSATRNVSPAS